MATRALAEIVIDFIPIPGGATIWKVLVSVHDLCEEVGDAKGTCLELHERLNAIFHEMERIEASRLLNNEAIPKFTKALKEYWYELDAYKNRTSVDRFFHHRKMKKVIAGINEELDHLVKLVGLASAGALVDWRRQYDIDMPAQKQQLLDVLQNGAELLDELRGIREQLGATVLLKAEVDKINNGKSDLDDEAQAAVRTALAAIARRSNKPVQATPKWFLSEADVDFDEIPFALGSFASVHRGTLSDGARIVVKMLLPGEGGLDENLQQDFMKEANLWDSLRHPHIVQMLGGCHVSSRPFIVCQEATNGSMNDFLENPSHRQHVWRLIYEAAQGLAHLHGKKIIHGDVRLANVLVTEDLKALLADFGLSRVKDKSKSMSKTKLKDGEFVEGNWRWKAPEAHTYKPQFASDVYGLAMSILEAYVGEPPFAKLRSEDEVKAKILNGDLPERPTGMTDRAWGLIVDMTKNDPTERISMKEVIKRLGELVNTNEPAPPSCVIDAPTTQSQSSIVPAYTEEPQTTSNIGALINGIQDSSDPQTKENFVRILADIAHEPNGAKLIGSRGGVPPLVALLSGKSEQLRHSALSVLVAVVRDKMNGMMFVLADGVSGLEYHLTSSSPIVRVEVLKQLGKMISCSDEIANSVAANGAVVDACLGHVTSAHNETRDAAGLVLRTLVKRHAAVHAIGRSGFAALMKLAKSQNVFAEETLMGAFETLLRASDTQPDEEPR